MILTSFNYLFTVILQFFFKLYILSVCVCVWVFIVCVIAESTIALSRALSVKYANRNVRFLEHTGERATTAASDETDRQSREWLAPRRQRFSRHTFDNVLAKCMRPKRQTSVRDGDNILN